MGIIHQPWEVKVAAHPLRTEESSNAIFLWTTLASAYIKWILTRVHYIRRLTIGKIIVPSTRLLPFTLLCKQRVLLQLYVFWVENAFHIFSLTKNNKAKHGGNIFCTRLIVVALAFCWCYNLNTRQKQKDFSLVA